jgi:membrane protease YdiL (CAAX protease family)
MSVKRSLLFLRSILPREPAQLGMLVGLICFLIAPNLRWAPRDFHLSHSLSSTFLRLGATAFIAISFSACAGYLVCFRPGIRPARRLGWLVCLPAGLGFVLMCCIFAELAFSDGSQGGNAWLHGFHWRILALSRLGPGFDYSLLGLVLVAGFTVRLALGSASLPLALPQCEPSADDSRSWRRVEIFLWVLLGLLPMSRWLHWTDLVFYFIREHLPAFKVLAAQAAQLFVVDATAVLIAIWVIGRNAWDDFRRSLSWPPVGSFILAILFPLGIAVLLSGGQFLVAMLHWIAYRSVGQSIPEMSRYAMVPSAGLLIFLLPALCEEIIFRGILQPHFVRRYGALRGVFLVGVVFAAAHFSEDFSVWYTDGMVILKLFARLGGTVPLSLVAGWLTFRTGSVLPAAVAHGLANVLGSSPLGPAFLGIGPVGDLLWAVLAYVLFRCWPVETKTPYGVNAVGVFPGADSTSPV